MAYHKRDMIAYLYQLLLAFTYGQANLINRVGALDALVIVDAKSQVAKSYQRRAIEAYKFFFPTMGTEAVMQQMLSNGAKINEIGHVMATTPLQQFVRGVAEHLQQGRVGEHDITVSIRGENAAGCGVNCQP